MPLTEPTTVLTDLALAAVAAALAGRMWRAGTSGLRLWAGSFAAAALAAAAGAARHGLADTLGAAGERALWLATVYAVGAGSALMLAGTALACSRGALLRALIGFSGLKLAGYAVWMAAHRDYLWVALDSAGGIAVVVTLLVREARAGRFAGLRRALLGFGVGLAGAALRQTGADLHPQFNHNDLYHVVQMISLWLLHQGALSLRDTQRRRGARAANEGAARGAAPRQA